MFYIYILKCEDGYLYTGITNNINRRLQEHQTDLCLNTKNRGKIEVYYKEAFKTRIDAAKREKEIKGWSRKKKEDLIKNIGQNKLK